MSNTDKSGSRGSIGRLNVGAASPHTGSSSNIGAHRGSATHLSATGATTSRSNLLGGSTGHLNTSQTQLTTSQTNLKQQQGSSRGSRGSLNAIGGGRGSVVATTSTSRIAPAHDAATADLLFKMSKKIAQLTKVVYVLNTQNEDVEREVRMARREHEREVAEVIARWGPEAWPVEMLSSSFIVAE